jgi:hypothetical protein
MVAFDINVNAIKIASAFIGTSKLWLRNVLLALWFPVGAAQGEAIEIGVTWLCLLWVLGSHFAAPTYSRGRRYLQRIQER